MPRALDLMTDDEDDARGACPDCGAAQGDCEHWDGLGPDDDMEDYIT